MSIDGDDADEPEMGPHGERFWGGAILSIGLAVIVGLIYLLATRFLLPNLGSVVTVGSYVVGLCVLFYAVGWLARDLPRHVMRWLE